MIVKKYPQSCLLFNIGKSKILIDAGEVKFDPSFIKEWQSADAVLITHRHVDHCNVSALKQIGKPIYTTAEVAKFYPDLKCNIVKEGDKLKIAGVSVEVTKAVHGYYPTMRESGIEISQNVGFILVDGKTRYYVTSDTIAFANDYKADYVFAPAVIHGVAFGPFVVAEFARSVGAKKVFITHQDSAPMIIPHEQLKMILDGRKFAYEVMENGKEYKL